MTKTSAILQALGGPTVIVDPFSFTPVEECDCPGDGKGPHWSIDISDVPTDIHFSPSPISDILPFEVYADEAA